MHSLVAYLLESPTLATPELSVRLESIRQSVSDWLRDKGAADPSMNAGTFISLTGDGGGNFTRTTYTTAIGTLDRIKLDEPTRAGQNFSTVLAVTVSSNRITVHCSLSVSATASVVAPQPTDPRCPTVVRTLLEQSTDWHISGTLIGSPEPRKIIGNASGMALANTISDAKRSLPIVVVSEIEGQELWPNLASKVATDLAGLAHVVIVDGDASWGLSGELGKSHSCYRGAVRLYWPPCKRADGETAFNSTTWTASQLLSNDIDGKGLNRFRATLRRLVMSTAALSIVAPSAIREIQRAVARRVIDAIQARAVHDSEELAIARLYLDENLELKAKLEELEQDLARTAARADTAEHALAQFKAPDISDAEDDIAESGSSQPNPGDTRFYKKVHSKPGYDVLQEVQDCRHTSWQNASKAEKAKKGLERLTKRSDWKSLQHCGACTGGGMWKVRW